MKDKLYILVRETYHILVKNKMKKKVKKKTKDEVYIELDGVVSVVDITNGKKTVTPLDSRLVLKMLKHLIEDSIKSKLAGKKC